MLAAERYAVAILADEYVANLRENRELFLSNIDQAEITDADLRRFGEDPLRILVLTEEWCIDSMQFLPVVIRLARELPDAEVRVLRRDEHEDLAANYRRKDGYQAIPVFILMDNDGEELGYLVERPQRVAEEMAAESRRFQKANPDLPGINRNFDRMPEETQAAVKANSRQWRTGQQHEFARFLIDELAEIVEQGRSERAA